eukprot:scaffold2443_cov67-Phaeocystis_antarctica.AAC.4
MSWKHVAACIAQEISNKSRRLLRSGRAVLFGGGTYAGRLRVYGADVVEWLVELWPKLWSDWRLASAGDGGGLVAEQPRPRGTQL